jgi:glutaminyl-tRNA synthetase
VVDSTADRLVFNRTVTLRDTWAKRTGAADAEDGRPRRTVSREREPAPAKPRPARPAEAPTRSPVLEAARARYVRELGIPEVEAEILTRDAATAALFEGAAASANAQSLANWIVHELPRERGDRDIDALPFGARELAALVQLVDRGAISGPAGRQVLAELAARGGDPAEIVERLGLRQVSDAGALEPIVDAVLSAHAGKVEAYREGRTGLLGFFVGQVLARSGGRANPVVVKDLLEKRLAG